jgi:hypothetical protein
VGDASNADSELAIVNFDLLDMQELLLDVLVQVASAARQSG